MSKYRVFISYSHQDLELVQQIVEILQDNDLTPMWDRNFAYGKGFHAQIEKFIAHAHVFLPIITETSDERKWVHQEIGYAMALNVPVLPVAKGKVPGEMIQQIHAVEIGEDVEPLRQKLSWEAIDNLVQDYSRLSHAFFQCANFAENRAEMMANYSDDVRKLGFHDRVRQKGALSSFHIPEEGINHPVWKIRYGGLERGPEHCRLQRGERVALEKHARAEGCKLIVNPFILYEKYGDAARIVRLGSLLKFLESMTNAPCEVAINDQMEHDQSVTILGDWFAAESVSARIGEGYRQTIFTRHAPSMMNKIDEFDQEFKERLEISGWSAETSRKTAIDLIQGIVAELKAQVVTPAH